MSSALRVTDELREDVLSGFFAPGSRLTEAALLERYGVSRVPVREALRALAGEGFVELTPNAGARVAEVPVADLGDLFRVRSVVEGLTAARCARDGVDVTELRELVVRGPSDSARLTATFHDRIAQLSGSSSLAMVLRQVSERIRWAYTTTVPQDTDKAWADHARILDAIEARDPERAEAEMLTHLDSARRGLLEGP